MKARLAFSGVAIEWRGPAPFIFIPLPEEASAQLATMGRELSYGWGCIAVRATIGATTWTTSLMPRAGIYLLPVKAVVQKAEGIAPGTNAEVVLDFS